MQLRFRSFALRRSALFVALAVLAVGGGHTSLVFAEVIDPGAKAETVPEPDGYRLQEYRKPVPATLKGATVLTPDQASALWSSGKAVFMDVYPYAPKPPNLPAGTVWREPVHFSIENAKWLANTGYGQLSPETEAYFKGYLERLSGGDKAKPLVFFCLRNCWMSWNASKRAMTYGYINVNWFSEGTDAWQEIGQPVAAARPEPALDTAASTGNAAETASH